MKKIVLGVFTAALLWTQPLMAGSANEGGERRPVTETIPVHRPDLGNVQLEAQDARVAPLAASGDSIPKTQTQVRSRRPVEARGIHLLRPKPRKFLDEVIKHEGEGKGMGLAITALALGTVGFLLGLTVVLWPVGLFFSIAAVVLGTISIAFGKRGKGFAIVALILGIFIMVIPMMAFALILTTAA
jgi:hypothetical protein